MENYLTCNDAAKVAEVSPDSIRLYEKTGKLAAIKTASGIRLFRKRDVEQNKFFGHLLPFTPVNCLLSGNPTPDSVTGHLR